MAGGRADHPCHCARGRFQRRDWRARLRRACSVPTWLRPYPVLSNGEKFRADLARLVCDAPERAIVDEFTSVVDRQIAKFGALAFAKAWRRLKGNQVVLLTPHYDVVEWLEPDWVFDTAKRSFARGLLRRPQFDLEIWQTAVSGRCLSRITI